MKLSNGLMIFDEREGDDDGIGRDQGLARRLVVTSPRYCATFAPTPLGSSPISVNGQESCLRHEQVCWRRPSGAQNAAIGPHRDTLPGQRFRYLVVPDVSMKAGD